MKNLIVWMLCIITAVTFSATILNASNNLLKMSLADTSVLSIQSDTCHCVTNDSAIIHLNLTNYTGVASVQVKIAFDSLLLTVKPATSTTRSSMLENVNSSITNNYIQVLMYSNSLDTIPSGTGVILNIPFALSSDAASGDSALLHISSLILSDQNAKVIPSKAVDEYIHFNTPGTQEKPFIKKFGISSISPNPVIGTVNIVYSIPATAHTSLKIYDSAGKLVRILIDEISEPAYYSTTWNANDNYGNKITSGTYFIKFATGNYKATRKLVLMR
jgi:hypothetical protein